MTNKKKNPFGYGLENDDAARRQYEALEANSSYGKTQSPLESFSVRPRAEEKLVRYLPLAFTAYAVPSCTTARIEVQPSVRFKGQLLVLASGEGMRYFDVEDMRVGSWVYNVSGAPISAELFLQLEKIQLERLDASKIAYLVESFGVDMRESMVGEKIILTIRNRGPRACDFHAALYGVSVEP